MGCLRLLLPGRRGEHLGVALTSMGLLLWALTLCVSTCGACEHLTGSHPIVTPVSGEIPVVLSNRNCIWLSEHRRGCTEREEVQVRGYKEVPNVHSSGRVGSRTCPPPGSHSLSPEVPSAGGLGPDTWNLSVKFPRDRITWAWGRYPWTNISG